MQRRSSWGKDLSLGHPHNVNLSSCSKLGKFGKLGKKWNSSQKPPILDSVICTIALSETVVVSYISILRERKETSRMLTHSVDLLIYHNYEYAIHWGLWGCLNLVQSLSLVEFYVPPTIVPHPKADKRKLNLPPHIHHWTLWSKSFPSPSLYEYNSLSRAAWEIRFHLSVGTCLTSLRLLTTQSYILIFTILKPKTSQLVLSPKKILLPFLSSYVSNTLLFEHTW